MLGGILRRATFMLGGGWLSARDLVQVPSVTLPLNLILGTRVELLTTVKDCASCLAQYSKQFVKLLFAILFAWI